MCKPLILVALGSMLLLGGCQTDQPTVEVPRYTTPMPPEQLFKYCQDRFKKADAKLKSVDVDKLTNTQLGDLIAKLYDSSLTCYSSNEQIHSFLVKSKTAVEQPPQR